MARLLPLFALLLVLPACSDAPEEPQEPSARVFFVSPASGDTLQSPVSIQMGAEGIEVAPAGTFEENTGHFHIIVDRPFVSTGSVVPADSAHIHYGTGATTASLDLAPGQHILRLQMADGAHIALEGLTDEISVVIQE